LIFELVKGDCYTLCDSGIVIGEFHKDIYYWFVPYIKLTDGQAEAVIWSLEYLEGEL